MLNSPRTVGRAALFALCALPLRFAAQGRGFGMAEGRIKQIADAQLEHPQCTPYRTRHFGCAPLVTKKTFELAGIEGGNNINGPSMIKVPEWLPVSERADPLANYYLYFAHHNGRYIRMAWAEKLQGPFVLFNVGNGNQSPGFGVLDMGKNRELTFLDSGLSISGHIASPNVHLDEPNKQFLLYFHAANVKVHSKQVKNDLDFGTGRQKTLMATSPNGLNFNNPSSSLVSGGVGGGHMGYGVRDQVLGNAYFTVFWAQEQRFAFTNYGPIWKEPKRLSNYSWAAWTAHRDSLLRAGSLAFLQDAWERGPNPVFEDLSRHFQKHKSHKRNDAGRSRMAGAPRHFAVRVLSPQLLEVWYTSRGDKPERIFQTTMGTIGNWSHWQTAVTDSSTVHDEMLRPRLCWEGAQLPLVASKNGAARTAENALRDPALFRDSDRWYLLYAGGGENGIGIMELHCGKQERILEMEDLCPSKTQENCGDLQHATSSLPLFRCTQHQSLSSWYIKTGGDVHKASGWDLGKSDKCCRRTAGDCYWYKSLSACLLHSKPCLPCSKQQSAIGCPPPPTNTKKFLEELFGSTDNLKLVAQAWQTEKLINHVKKAELPSAMENIRTYMHLRHPVDWLWWRLTRIINQRHQLQLSPGHFYKPGCPLPLKTRGACLGRNVTVGREILNQWNEEMGKQQGTNRTCAEAGDGHFLREFYKQACSSILIVDKFSDTGKSTYKIQSNRASKL